MQLLHGPDTFCLSLLLTSQLVTSVFISLRVQTLEMVPSNQHKSLSDVPHENASQTVSLRVQETM
jgi:hypothetical protein